MTGPHFSEVHRLICEHCRTPCERWHRGEIDHTDRAEECPIGQWYSIDRSFFPEIENPHLRRQAASPSSFVIRHSSLPSPPPCCPPDPALWGPPLWRELHARAAGGAMTAEWLEAWLARVPCGECRRDARGWLAEHPPDSRDAAAQTAWAVGFHNAVRARLGQPAWEPVEGRGSKVEGNGSSAPLPPSSFDARPSTPPPSTPAPLPPSPPLIGIAPGSP